MKLTSALRGISVAAVLALTLTACGAASEGDDDAAWPDENLEMLIGFGAGGTPDLLGRAVGDHLQERHNVNVTATNRTGGASTIALNEALSAPADGTTLALATSNGLLWQPLVESGLEYDQTEGYEALAKVGESPFSLMVAADGDFETMDDFIDAADAGEELAVAVTGEGAQTDLTVQQLNEQNDWQLRSVPYTDGAGEGILAVMRGEVDAQVSTTAGVQGQIDAGDVNILAVLSDENEPENPDVPTVDEFGLDVPMGTSFYVVTTDEIDDQLRDEMIAAMDDLALSAEWTDTLRDLGLPESALNHEDTQEEIATLIEEYDTLEP
ncbi:tripartite tricarboxylate transporter substrate binding protein [Enteractinococcus fodinae]|uniref:Tripartite-type tricarboxylate transporter receptor subunit TctC n=1 Tax=Enteractinococcus fodinae TaxID=684663 RepID=A0ABU2AWX0_9MICC|nr:tripartite tricarboxylate transporter substrate binding protein [Enteractinococcus fodinae]MDR7345837.1 tripartite-type tricarboxylate transporter receptor subunit TctC [Enteractinococcus fodinae]